MSFSAKEKMVETGGREGYAISGSADAKKGPYKAP
jgi:hypothetical protein